MRHPGPSWPVPAAAMLVLAGLAVAQHQPHPSEAEASSATAEPAVEYTLKEVMEHLAHAHAEIERGLLTNNRLMIRRGAEAIADHPAPKGGIAPYLRPDLQERVPTIRAMDEEVHDRALEIARRADTGPMLELHRLETRMTEGCIGCHEVFRD